MQLYTLRLEYINDNIYNRKKLLIKLGIALLIIILYNFCKYYFAPLEYQIGEKSSRIWFSYNQFFFFSILSILIIIPIIVSAKIVCKLIVDTDENKLEIDYIDRFRLKPNSKSVKLSQTIIQVEEIQYRNRNFVKSGEVYYKLHLSNPEFGHIKISSLDFKKINDIAKYFQTLKDSAAIKSRQARLRKMPRR